MLGIFAIYLSVFAISLFGIELFRRWSLKRGIFDIPNERSSHTVPTPRGGGVIICLVSILTIFVYSLFSGSNLYWPYLIGSIIVAAISLVDDLKNISPFSRILFHSLAAGLVIWWLGGFEKIFIPFYGVIKIGIIGDFLAFLWIVWLINAYNFMDGIDGIAAMQAVSAGIGWSLVGGILELDSILFIGGVLAATSFAFLLYNWQPARIFMGDVGSAFLGYSFAVLPLLGARRIENHFSASILPWIAMVLVWFFVFDSLYTLLKRLIRKEKVWLAHREHIYQKLVISGLPHYFVTAIYGTASIILVFVLIVTLKYSLSFEKTILLTVFVETTLLLLFKQKFVQKIERLQKN